MGFFFLLVCFSLFGFFLTVLAFLVCSYIDRWAGLFFYCICVSWWCKSYPYWSAQGSSVHPELASPPGCRVRHRESMSVLFSWISALKLLHFHFHGISLNCDKTTVKLEICIRKCSTCYIDATVRNNPLKCQKSKNTQHNVTEVTELVCIT